MAAFRCPDPCASSSSTISTSSQRICQQKCDARLCPYCGLGVFVKNTSVAGYIASVLCFPCALYCCLTKSCCYVVECTYCRAVTDKSLDEIYRFNNSDDEEKCERKRPTTCITQSEAELQRRQKRCEHKWWWLSRKNGTCKQRKPSNSKPAGKPHCYEKPKCPPTRLPRYDSSVREFYGAKTERTTIGPSEGITEMYRSPPVYYS